MTKRILVVDDHAEMLAFLSSMLELSDRGYEVQAVPSAEAALDVLTVTPIDLLITDLRLPGASGFDLVRRLKEARPRLPIIMITAYSLDLGRQEAEELGIFRYFQKPLDADALLESVQAALESTLTLPSPQRDESTLIHHLETLRASVDAGVAFLTTTAGSIVAVAGENKNLDLPSIAVAVSALSTQHSALSGRLGSNGGADFFHYHSGGEWELYSANAGRHHVLALLFDKERKGRIATVWVFTQRAVRKLQPLLPSPPHLLLQENDNGRSDVLAADPLDALQSG